MAETIIEPASPRWRPRPVPWTLARLALALAVLLGTGAGLAGWTMLDRRAADRSPFSRLVKIRLAAIKAQISQISGDYILIIGDSHVERLFLPSLCGVPVVNAGLSGAASTDLAALAAGLAEVRRPMTVIASFGTNDMLATGGQPVIETRFPKTALGLERQLSTLSRRVVVTDLPPMRPLYSLVSDDIIQGYGNALSTACLAAGCRFVRLFGAAADNPATGIALEPDGVHLKNYRQVYLDSKNDLCPWLTDNSGKIEN